jgi:AcrR family transcriptional regulator
VTEAPTRGRPRSPEAHRAILEATLELLVEGGFRALSMDAVAARAGVGKATIYRRWRSKTELVSAAVKLLNADIDLADTGTLRGDYLAIARQAMGAMNTPVSTIAPRLVAEATGEPELHAIFLDELVVPRRRALKILLRRAEERGEIRTGLDYDIVVDLLAGPVMYRLLVAAIGLKVPRNYPAKVFDQVFAGIAAA